VDSATLRAVAEAGGGTSFRVRTMDDLEAMAATLDRLEPNPMDRPPVRAWQPLWTWPAAAAAAFAALSAVRRRT
jgi:Ca-activated chloride channel family protein